MRLNKSLRCELCRNPNWPTGIEESPSRDMVVMRFECLCGRLSRQVAHPKEILDRIDNGQTYHRSHDGRDKCNLPQNGILCIPGK
jgi:hypothetical protein